MKQPIGSKQLNELARGKKSAVILISDGSRLAPSHLMLPVLLEELHAGGIPDEAVDVVIALGLHRKHSAEEIEHLVGSSIYRRVRIHNHSSLSEDCVFVGTTSAGTPLEINRIVATAPLLIATGNIEPHAMVGISGGVKAMVPGTASHRTIEHNHGLSLKYKAEPGKSDNPIHRDLEEVLRFVPIHFLLNTIVDIDKNVLEAVAGDVMEAHRAGISLASQRFVVPPEEELYDVVIASPGGDPKDKQMYQAIKSMKNAAAFTKPGGTIIIAAQCSEMLGNGTLQYWVDTMPSRDWMVRKLKEQFVIGAHKILHIDELLQQHQVYLYSSLPSYLPELLGLHAVQNLQQTIDTILTPGMKVGIMPYASLTFAGQIST
jgi:lactate racemase